MIMMKIKKAKGTKIYVIKQRNIFKDYKTFLEANPLEIDNLGENHNKFIKNNTLILKSQQYCIEC